MIARQSIIAKRYLGNSFFSLPLFSDQMGDPLLHFGLCLAKFPGLFLLF